MIADLERWRLEGLKRAAKLRLEISSINEAAAVIENVFGDTEDALGDDDSSYGNPVGLETMPISQGLRG